MRLLTEKRCILSWLLVFLYISYSPQYIHIVGYWEQRLDFLQVSRILDQVNQLICCVNSYVCSLIIHDMFCRYSWIDKGRLRVFCRRKSYQITRYCYSWARLCVMRTASPTMSTPKYVRWSQEQVMWLWLRSHSVRQPSELNSGKSERQIHYVASAHFASCEQRQELRMQLIVLLTKQITIHDRCDARYSLSVEKL